ncbi:MAG: D-arabinono-1,4-lactone oxidase [Bacteroidia bacterium]
MRYRNWGHTVDFSPQRFHKPSDEKYVQDLIVRAAERKHTVRVVGAGHSWTNLIETPDDLVSLDELSGPISFSGHMATLWAGTRLYKATRELLRRGFCLANQGDIDRQSLAGAFSTGTHGTGKNFGILATQAVGYRFIDGQGRIHEVWAHTEPELFRHLQVSLGLLGIITQISLQVVPAYRLRLTKRREPLEACLEKSTEYIDLYRHFEFFWFPYSDVAALKLTELTDLPTNVGWWQRWVIDRLWENGAFWMVSKYSQLFPQQSKRVSRFAAHNLSDEIRIDWAPRIFATPRWVRFREMEYAVVPQAGPLVLREIRKWLEKENFPVHFPIEYRYVKGDTIPLSPAYGGDRIFIAVHAYVGMAYEKYFSAVEEIFQAHEGRPHWGKMHTASAAYLHKVYPEMESFYQVAKEYDPAGVFRTPYLRSLFEG